MKVGILLFWACQEGHIEVVKYLVEHGADINKENNTKIWKWEKKRYENIYLLY